MAIAKNLCVWGPETLNPNRYPRLENAVLVKGPKKTRKSFYELTDALLCAQHVDGTKVPIGELNLQLLGRVYGNRRFEDGEHITTSDVQSLIWENNGEIIAVTENSKYILCPIEFPQHTAGHAL